MNRQSAVSSAESIRSSACGSPPDVAFVSFCIEMYAKEFQLSGATVIQEFEHSGVLDYLFKNYEALHTQGWGYILPLITGCLEDRGNL
ncbi:hypothetical protein FACS1894163_06040 [Spirochaetia bacterium]|nr:hypothetical protein FACS1894163_06040 [Spirochaetia bacterium]